MTAAVDSRDDVSIAYDVRGTGPTTLVLIHGWSCDRTYWSGQADALASEYRVVMLDLAGHGASGRDRKDWTIESLGADVAAVLVALDLKETVLVGHSMGADVAVDAALLTPDRVKGIVWLDQYNELDTQLSDDEVAKIVEPFRADFSDATQGFVRECFPQAPIRRWLNALRPTWRLRRRKSPCRFWRQPKPTAGRSRPMLRR